MTLQTGDSERFNVRHAAPNGVFPNSTLPALMYRGAVAFETKDPKLAEQELNQLLEHNYWKVDWLDSVYKRPHFHSTAHELLVVFEGGALLKLGGPNTKSATSVMRVKRGDALIIPAGMAHQCIEKAEAFKVFGAYPQGQIWDMMYGDIAEYRKAQENIANVPLPIHDPIYGGEYGKLYRFWDMPRPGL